MGTSRAGPAAMAGLVVIAQLLAMVTVGAGHALSPDFYERSCPSVFSIVRAEVKKAVKVEKRMAASLVRLHFHDCFVNGCDGSLLLDNSTTFVSEKFSLANINSVRGFEVIDTIKAALESACPNTVSCADILAIASRDSAVEVGLVPGYRVLVGRRDSLTPGSLDLTNDRLPSPRFNYSQLKQNFANVGLDEKDLIALSGAHTIGRVQCGAIRFSGVLTDASTNPEFRKKLELLCPANGLPNVTQDLDYRTKDRFDNNYYKNLRHGEGIIRSDQTLQSTEGPNQELVRNYARNQENFFYHFAVSTIKMGNIKPPAGSPSEVRTNCRVVNRPSLIAYE